MLPIIDISRWQGEIDWAQAAPAISGAVIRCTTGSTRVDERYALNWRESGRAGVRRRGIYAYIVTEADPIATADLILKTTGGDFGTEPVTLDCERREDEKAILFPKARYTANLERLVGHLAARVPNGVRIYTSAYEWSHITTQPAWATELLLWIADYRGLPQPALPPGWDWQVWQYTSSGHVPGIAGSVDLNRERAMRKLCLQTLGTSADIHQLAACAVKLVDDFGAAADFAWRRPRPLIVGRVAVPQEQEPDCDARGGAEHEDDDAILWAQPYFLHHYRERVLAHPDIDAWEGPNERNIRTSAGMRWYAEFEAERVRLLATLGKKAVVGNFAVGWPDPALWQFFAPAFDALRRHGGWLGLHEYWVPGREWDGAHTGRFQDAPRDIPKLITEAGFDGLPDIQQGGAWKKISDLDTYVNSLLAYDARVQACPDVGAVFIYHATVGGPEQWVDYNVEGAGLVARLNAYAPAPSPTAPALPEQEVPMTKDEYDALLARARNAALSAQGVVDALVALAPPVLYQARANRDLLVRDAAGATTGQVVRLGELVSVYADGLTAGGYSDRARIDPDGRNVWAVGLTRVT